MAVDEPMAKARRKLKLNEVSLVPSGANAGARVALFKAAHGPCHPEDKKRRKKKAGDLAAIVRAAFGKDGDAMTFDDAVAQTEARELMWMALDKVRTMFWTLEQSVDSIVSDDDVKDKPKMIRASLDQFKDALAAAIDELPTAAQKHGEPGDTDMTLKEFSDALKALEVGDDVVAKIAKLAGELVGETDQAVIDKLATETKRADDAETERDAAVKAAEKGDGGAAGGKPVNKAGMSEDQIAQVAALEKSDAEKNDRIQKLEDAADDETVTKSLDAIENMPGDREELHKLLKGLDAENREKVLATWRKTDEIAKGAAKLFLESGHGGANDAGSATAKVEQLAKELREGDTKLTEHQAKARIWQSNPDLKKQYNAERDAAH